LLISRPNHPSEKNINLRAATLHVIGDLISSLGVLLSSIIIIVDPTKTIVDPICTFLFSGLVLFTTYHVVRDSLAILMEGTPGHINPAAVTQSLSAINGVTNVHDLHIWTLTAGKSSLAVHLVIADDSPQSHSIVLLAAQHIVCDEYGIHHSTIQLEMAEAGHCYPGMCATDGILGIGGPDDGVEDV
jgi:cation diffusion facilitator family transporter